MEAERANLEVILARLSTGVVSLEPYGCEGLPLATAALPGGNSPPRPGSQPTGSCPARAAQKTN